jgi:hypothetical protein
MLHSPRTAEVSEHMTRLIYELLDAHDDTARLANGLMLDERWRAHLAYLRDLQRVGREGLASELARGALTNDPAREPLTNDPAREGLASEPARETRP